MLENSEIFFNYSNITTNELINLLANNENLSLLNFLSSINYYLESNNDFEKICTDLIKIKDAFKYFDSEDIGYIQGFLSILGKSDTNGQIINCKTYKEFFKQKLYVLEKEEKSKCKTQAVVSMGFGMLLIIMVI